MEIRGLRVKLFTIIEVNNFTAHGLYKFGNWMFNWSNMISEIHVACPNLLGLKHGYQCIVDELIETIAKIDLNCA